jgi:Asp-tRNA(Asn)/Glu-tRNA(Gln) amidotransferase A subunit family amidase
MTTRTDGRSSPKALGPRGCGDERVFAVAAAALVMLMAGTAQAQAQARVSGPRIVAAPGSGQECREVRELPRVLQVSTRIQFAGQMTEAEISGMAVCRPLGEVEQALAVVESALAELREMDGETRSVVRWVAAAELGPRAGSPDSPLWAFPILLKDNIETADMPTTAGSLALTDNAPGRDAPLVTRLRESGAIIAGKTNLSEWANIRSPNSISGWSAVGGQTLNPYDPARTPCGSSSGSAVAVAIGLAPAAIGTETDGSITCPASVNGVVGFKPTVGLVSRTHIVPISHSQDTAGPIATTVQDAAAGADGDRRQRSAGRRPRPRRTRARWTIARRWMRGR